MRPTRRDGHVTVQSNDARSARRAIRALAASLIALAIFGSSSAFAVDAKEAAKTHFEKGVALSEQQAWDAALAEFVRSRELFPTRGAAKNAAICLRKLGRYDEALDTLERLLNDYPTMPQDDRWVIDGEVRELRALVGTITVKASEPGATVVVDGRGRGNAPAESVRVPAGTRLVQVYKEGFIPLELRVEVAGGQARTVNAALKPLTRSGRLVVGETAGKPAQVVVDGMAIGKTPYSGLVPPGRHVIFLRGEGNLGSQPAAIELKQNETTSLALALVPLEAELVVEPTPADASVALDGVVLGQGQWRGRVRTGGHRIEVAQAGFLPSPVAITSPAGQTTRIRVVLERDPTSALWGERSRPRLTFDVGAGLVRGFSFGGPLGGCDAPCGRSAPIGAIAMFRAGYELASGLGFTLDAGYVGVTETTSDRPAVLTELADGLRQSFGTTSDRIGLRALMFGGSFAYHNRSTSTFTWMARLGGGAMIGSVSDLRTGSFSFAGGAPYGVGPYREVESLTSAYVAPEIRAGIRLGSHFELSAGILGAILVSPTAPSWKDKNEVVTPVVGGMGLGRFGEEAMIGKVVFLLAPNVGLRYSFAL